MWINEPATGVSTFLFKCRSNLCMALKLNYKIPKALGLTHLSTYTEETFSMHFINATGTKAVVEYSLLKKIPFDIDYILYRLN